MKFSIVTCTWNSRSFIHQSVESVLGQTHSDIEFIFVDGGSDDGTLEYLRSVDRPKTILENVRGGIARAMNVGTQAAHGDVIMHLHSDDYLLHSRALERAAHLFKTTGCSWLIGRILNEREGGLYPESYVPPAYSYKNLLKSNFVPHASTFVSRDLYLSAGGFSEKLRFAMDYDMWLRLGRIAPPHATREAFSVFRRHADSTTEKNRLGSFDEDHAVRQQHLSASGASILERSVHQLRHHVRRHRLKALLKQAGRPATPTRITS
jgi:glycosyltransferase involved in cell wall biosynthesis